MQRISASELARKKPSASCCDYGKEANEDYKTASPTNKPVQITIETLPAYLCDVISEELRDAGASSADMRHR